MEGVNTNQNETNEKESLDTPETRGDKIRKAEIVVKSMFDTNGDAISIIKENPKVSDQTERNF